MIAGLITAVLFAFAIALLADPRRGRHHVHARLFARPFERELEAHGTRPLDPRPARALADYVATCERATPEQLGAMSV